MKKSIIISFLIFFTIIVHIHAQDYPFLPEDLRLVSQEEYMSKPPSSPMDFGLVYYEDGTKTTFQDAGYDLSSGKLLPKMYVNSKGEYKAMVLVKNESVIKYKNIPEELSELGYSVGNPESDIVIVNAQGGPASMLMNDDFEGMLVQRGGVDLKKTFLINVHQVQTLHQYMFSQNVLTFEEIKEHSKETTKMLADMINYFKSENKKVLVTGSSFGAFVVQDLLAQYGNIADGYLIMVGRLDWNEQAWKSCSEGNMVMFKYGTEVTTTSPELLKAKEGIFGTPIGINMTKLAAGLGYKRYTQLLKKVDLSNVIYLYGKNDEMVGRLTDHEVDFLESKNVKVITSYSNHNSTMDKYSKRGLELLLEIK